VSYPCLIGLYSLFRVSALIVFANLSLAVVLLASALYKNRAIRLSYILAISLSIIGLLVLPFKPPFFLFLVGYIFLTWLLADIIKNKLFKGCGYAVWTLMSSLLILHQAPGYVPILLAEAFQLKHESQIAHYYLNSDKVWVAWSLLMMLANPLKSVAVNRPFSTYFTGLAVLLVPLTLLLATSLGLIAWQPAFSSLILLLIVSNLIHTCIAEELLFRGVIQTQLTRLLKGWGALLVTSLIFGLAHVAGGWSYVIVASIAGFAYGLIYFMTGQLLWAILVHWLLNSLHLIFFTYPMLIQASS